MGGNPGRLFWTVLHSHLSKVIDDMTRSFIQAAGEVLKN